ncbi:MAG: hypothetical protein HQ582_19580, partial [Planctomycetes bacterium]|nr:hypothetical protein [Planctomycetota bacterium]
MSGFQFPDGSNTMVKRLFLLLVVTCWFWCGSWAEAGAAESPSGVSQQQVEVGGLDLAIILGYLVGIVGLGGWAGMRRQNQQ